MDEFKASEPYAKTQVSLTDDDVKGDGENVDQRLSNIVAVGVALVAVVVSLGVAFTYRSSGQRVPLFSIIVGATVASIALEYYVGDRKKHLNAAAKGVALLGAIAVFLS